MSWSAVTLAYRYSLPPAQKAVLVALAYVSHMETGRCNPSIARLMADTGYSDRHVQGALRALEKAGIITVARSDGGRSRTHSYTINPEPPSPFLQKPRTDFTFSDDKPRTQFTVPDNKPRTQFTVSTETPKSTTLNPEHTSPDPILGRVREEGRAPRTKERDAEGHRRLMEVKQKWLR